MILFTWAEKLITGPDWLCVTAGRWKFGTHDEGTNGIGFFEQRKFKSDNQWHDVGRYYGIWFGGWRWGYEAFYYDGEHHTLSLGPIQFAWCYS
jgi:hypothetical protein